MPGEAHHYSNFAFALLGRWSRHLSGERYTDYVDERIIGPLGLGRTTWRRRSRRRGLSRRRVRPHRLARARAGSRRDRRGRSTLVDGGGSRPLGDVPRARRGRRPRCRDARADVVSAGHVLPGQLGARLGARVDALQPRRHGSMQVTAARWPATCPASTSTGRREIGAAAVTNSGTRADMEIDRDPARSEDGRAVAGADRSVAARGGTAGAVRALLGRWWSEGTEFVFWWEGGALKARVVGSAEGSRRDDVRARRRRVASPRPGRERGERLRVDGDRLIWAGYPFTRSQQPFPARRSDERVDDHHAAVEPTRKKPSQRLERPSQITSAATAAPAPSSPPRRGGTTAAALARRARRAAQPPASTKTATCIDES